MSSSDLAQHVEPVRRFNRFYTKRIGALQDHFLKSPFSLTEARVLYELAHHQQTTASVLSDELGLDPGYLSRILRRFQQRGLLRRRVSDTDARSSLLWLTDKGQDAFARLNADQRAEIEALLGGLGDGERRKLVEAMRTIEGLLAAAPEARVPYILRPPAPGDIGWVVQRHGALYAREYGWDEQFEALVAEIVAKFIRTFDPKRERCWMAEKDGESVGCVFCVQRSRRVAQLRLLLVEPRARGLGIGERLVNECVRFARQAGYRKIMLWTNDVLKAARRIYEKTGFRLTHQAPHHSFGHDLVGQTWELDLSPAGGRPRRR